MRLDALLAGVECHTPIPQDVEIEGISYDTRTIKPGELFVAVPGYNGDGHEYIAQAKAKGAAAVVAQRGEECILVPDSRKALAAISANWFDHPARALTLSAVTGTNGKTTVTTLLWHILTQTLDAPVGLIGTNAVRVGEESFPACRTTPESYQLQQWLRKMADGGCTHVVMEASSHALCLHRLDGVEFAVGGFTNLTQDHLDFHKTMEAYRDAKGRLFGQCAKAVLNLDDPVGRHYAGEAECETLGYSQEGNGDALTALDVRLHPDAVEFTAALGEESARVRLGVPGQFSVANALCALGCAHCLGVSLERAAQALGSAKGVKGRMEVVPHPGAGTVIIDYAHTPDAMEQALATLRQATPGRLVCLFGCGGDRDRGKRLLMGAVCAHLADVCVVTSDNPRSEPPGGIITDILQGMVHFDTVRMVEPDREKAVALALSLLKEGDTLLLAGKGHEDYQEVNGEKRHLDERELVRAYYGRGIAIPPRM